MLDAKFEARLAKAALFMQVSATAGRLPPDERCQLEELLTGDWDGRGLAGESGRRLLTLARNFETWSYHEVGRAWYAPTVPLGVSPP